MAPPGVRSVHCIYSHIVKASFTFLRDPFLRILCLTKTKHKDKQTSAALEKKIRAEREARASMEKQMVELQAQKMEEAANSAWNLANRYNDGRTQGRRLCSHYSSG